MTDNARSIADPTGLADKMLQLHLVGSRRYVRAVDILTAMQELTGASVVDIRFLRPTDRHLRVSLSQQDKPGALARVYISSSSTPVHLLRHDHGPLRVLDEMALPAFEVATSGNGAIFDFSFASVPDHSTLLQTVFAQYQQISGEKFTVRRLATRGNDTDNNSTVRLTVEKPNHSSRGCFGSITTHGKTLFDIWFQPRLTGN